MSKLMTGTSQNRALARAVFAGLALLSLGATSSYATQSPTPSAVRSSVISSKNPLVSTAFGKALVGPVTLSRSAFASGVNLSFGARYENQNKVEEIIVNFDDNNIDKDAESLVFYRGDFMELDSSKTLPSFLVDGSGARPESYCVMRLNRVASEYLVRDSSERWTLKEGTTVRLDPYTPAPVRSHKVLSRLALNLELVTPESVTQKKGLKAEFLRCELYLENLDNVETRIVPELEKILGQWLQFRLEDASQVRI